MLDIEKERTIWKTYPDYPFLQANQFGEIRTIDRIVTRSNGMKQFIKGRVLKQHDNGKGYMQVSFTTNGKKITLKVHRIVAICFIPNPDNLPEVNHIDNNPSNNAVSNLEWCSRKYNEGYKKNFGTSAAEIQGSPVIAVNPETSDVLWFESQHEAGRQLGVDNSNINRVVKGKLNKTGGYWFCYADENAVERTREKFGDDIANKVEKLISDNQKIFKKQF